MRKIFYILFIINSCSSLAQSIAPRVVNTAGSSRRIGSSEATVADNVGEPATISIFGTAAMPRLTQGFIQPEAFVKAVFKLSVTANDVTCSGKNDGRISTAISASTGYKATYLWTPTVVCPGSNCSSIDSLQGGTYSLTVVFSYSTLAGTAKRDTADTVVVIKDIGGICKIKVFTGLTANGDGLNDHLYIENIDAYPNNRVTIYNRWGGQLYDEHGYDNVTKYWPTNGEESKLVASTYFYVIDLGDGSKPLKGWIELIKN